MLYYHITKSLTLRQNDQIKHIRPVCHHAVGHLFGALLDHSNIDHAVADHFYERLGGRPNISQIDAVVGVTHFLYRVIFGLSPT